MYIFGYSGGGGGGWIALPSYPLTYNNLQNKIWTQSDKDFLSYCENDEVSADAAQRWLNHSIPHVHSYGGYNKGNLIKEWIYRTQE